MHGVIPIPAVEHPKLELLPRVCAGLSGLCEALAPEKNIRSFLTDCGKNLEPLLASGKVLPENTDIVGNRLECLAAGSLLSIKDLCRQMERPVTTEQLVSRLQASYRLHEPDVAVKERTDSKGVKKILMLEDLDCANCAAKIETQIKDIQGVNDATVDFVSKKLAIEAADKKDLNRILGEITAIVKKIEPDVKVVDPNKNKGNKSAIMLNGLDCANCAAKIEAEVKNLEGVRFASVDFVSKKLTMVNAGMVGNAIIDKSKEKYECNVP